MYKCINTECKELGVEKSPGGRIIIKDGKHFYTGAICTHCKEVMEEIYTGMPNYTVVNPGDGRNW